VSSRKRANLPAVNKTTWLCRSKEKILAGFFQLQAANGAEADSLRIPGLESKAQYRVTTRPQQLYIKRFGGLVKHIMPITLNPNGFILRTINRFYTLTDCVESYECNGKTLSAGVLLNNQFSGSHYNDKTRLLGDFGSSLYTIEAR
jgi:alpha-galactosidase